MIATALQQDIAWQDVKANLRSASKALNSAPPSDLYVLPEMFATGFTTDTSILNTSETDTITDWLSKESHRLNAAVCASVATMQDNTWRNRLFFAMPDGTMVHYDKRHLFAYGRENDNYAPGETRTIVTFRGIRFLLLVCYDLRFPVWSRNKGDYDAIIYVANWPTSRRRVWDSLIVARAIENQAYVIASNRIGTDVACEYSGGSAIIDAYGGTISSCNDAEPGAATAHIDIERLNAFRQKFPVLADADDFTLTQKNQNDHT